MDSASYLILDTASPIVSIALGGFVKAEECPAKSGVATVFAERTLELRRSSERLLGMVEEVLEEASCCLDELSGIVVLRGPGSFTGLRIGLSTVLGLHQATGLPATTLDTAQALAAAATTPDVEASKGDAAAKIVAAVDALRGDWWTRSYRLRDGIPEPIDEGGLRSGDSLGELAPCCVVGFGVDQIAVDLEALGIERRTPPALATPTLSLIGTLGEPSEWDASRLTRPIYQRAPAVTPRRLPKGS